MECEGCAGLEGLKKKIAYLEERVKTAPSQVWNEAMAKLRGLSCSECEWPRPKKECLRCEGLVDAYNEFKLMAAK
jgi:hypothetical protein